MKYFIVVLSLMIFSCSSKGPVSSDCREWVDTIGWKITYEKDSSEFTDEKIVSSIPVLDTIQDTLCE